MTSFIAALTVVLALAIHLSTAQTPKSKFDSKVKVLGVTFYTITELSKLTDCVDDSFYDLATMDQLKTKAINCALNNTPAAKYITLMSMMSSMDKCLKPENQTTWKLLDKVTPAGKQVLQKIYDQVIGTIKSAKAAGKSKSEALDAGYTTATTVMTKPLIEQVCKTLVDVSCFVCRTLNKSVLSLQE
ncbi:unnamed protein product [Heligmosomoides polygyrus]|uniref:PMEI domain-containing protein n=1 Tax=Heligmosomoides polygyrus TaxID=6339 RepID=A0A183GKH3_HELPZ|nr:unnamed protein product [Heligmosomoides polygyrus]